MINEIEDILNKIEEINLDISKYERIHKMIETAYDRSTLTYTQVRETQSQLASEKNLLLEEKHKCLLHLTDVIKYLPKKKEEAKRKELLEEMLR